MIHPFNDGNGRISRLLTNYLLIKEGFNFIKYSSLEYFILLKKDEYTFSLRKWNNGWNDSANTYIPFVEFTISILIKCINEIMDKKNFLIYIKDNKLNKKETISFIMKYLYSNNIKISKTNIIEMLNNINVLMNEDTIKDTLKLLRENKFICQKEFSVKTYYELIIENWNEDKIRKLLGNKKKKK